MIVAWTVPVVIDVTVETVVAVTAVVEIETVFVTVAVALSSPPNGENRIIVDGAPRRTQVPPGGQSEGGNMGEPPTIQPLLGEVMKTESSGGGTIGSPMIAGARVMWVHAMPSQ